MNKHVKKISDKCKFQWCRITDNLFAFKKEEKEKLICRYNVLWWHSRRKEIKEARARIEQLKKDALLTWEDLDNGGWTDEHP
jgi:hypothetical protein